MVQLYKIKAVNKLTKDVKFVIFEHYHDEGSIILTTSENDGTMFTEIQAEKYIQYLSESKRLSYSDEYEFSKWYTHLLYDPISGEMTDDI